jgi:hypothetical protein
VDLFKTLSVQQVVVSTGENNRLMINWELIERGRGLIEVLFPIYPKGMKKSSKSLNHDNQCPVRTFHLREREEGKGIGWIRIAIKRANRRDEKGIQGKQEEKQKYQNL